MILIGSSSRNSGKTTLAKAIIEKYKGKRAVYGIKITSISEKNSRCIHGDRACGLCSSFDDDYIITEELCKRGNKDTETLLRSGAEKVFWLKTLVSHIDEGISELLEKIPEDVLIVCESNSLRKVLSPGLFIMMRREDNEIVKSSAQEVIEKADIVYSLNSGVCINELIQTIDQKWRIN